MTLFSKSPLLSLRRGSIPKLRGVGPSAVPTAVLSPEDFSGMILLDPRPLTKMDILYIYVYIYKLNFHDMNIIIIYIYILIYLIHINSIEVPCASICTTLVVATIWILSQGSPAVFCRMIIQQIASKMRPAVQQPRIPNNPFLRVHRQKHCTNSVRHK